MHLLDANTHCINLFKSLNHALTGYIYICYTGAQVTWKLNCAHQVQGIPLISGTNQRGQIRGGGGGGADQGGGGADQGGGQIRGGADQGGGGGQIMGISSPHPHPQRTHTFGG